MPSDELPRIIPGAHQERDTFSGHRRFSAVWHDAAVEPTEAINLLEKLLRDVVRTVLGDDWKKVIGIDLARVEEKRTEDLAKRRGTLGSGDLLDYTEFTQLQSLLLDNWTMFAPALGKKKYVEAYLDRLAGFRNPAMHSRDLAPFERAWLTASLVSSET